MSFQNYEGSCLSHGVYHIICGLNEEYKNKFQTEDTARDLPLDILKDFLTEDLTISNHVVENEDCSIDYLTSVKRILPICYAIHKQLMQVTNEDFNESLGMDLDWTGSRKRILECLSMLKSKNDSEIVLCISLLFSILEHSLGNVFVSLSVSKQCPTNLKELLVAKEIQDVIGEDVAKVAFVIAGPPQGVNLRNVLWHGFVSGNEIPPQYGSFLVMMMVYIGKKCSGIDIKRRPMMTFCKLDNLLHVFPVIDCDTHLIVISKVLSETTFISTRMLPIWKRALFYYQEQKYGHAMALLMPQLENSLRQVFAWANGCPDRILTAESTTLYTTFDEMLASLLPDGSENQLRSHIGDNYLEMLMDVLVYSAGPRIRDHLSHGEVNLDMLPKDLCSHLICICAVFSLYFCKYSSVLHNNRQESKDLNCSVKIFGDTDSLILNSEKVLPHESIDLTSAILRRHAMLESNTELDKFKSNNDNCPHEAAFDSTSYSARQTLIINDKEFSKLKLNTSAEDNLHQEAKDSTITSIRQIETFVEQLVSISNNYQSVYHPFQILKREICSASKLFEHSVSMPCSLDIEDDFTSLKNGKMVERTWRVLCSTNKTTFSDFSALLTARPFSKGIYKLCSDVCLQTLYRPRRELEVVGLLHSTVQHYCNTTMQVHNMASQRYQQWQDKDLRSRQRTNYKRLLSLLPFYCNTLKIALLLVVIELISLQDKSLDPGYIKSMDESLTLDHLAVNVINQCSWPLWCGSLNAFFSFQKI